MLLDFVSKIVCHGLLQEKLTSSHLSLNDILQAQMTAVESIRLHQISTPGLLDVLDWYQDQASQTMLPSQAHHKVAFHMLGGNLAGSN